MLKLWPPDAKSWLIWKDPDAGKDWGQEEKGMTEDEMVGWHHRLDGHGFGWTPGVGDGQGGVACCNLWGHKESDMTERLNWTELNIYANIIFIYTLFGFSGSSAGKESACNAGDSGSIPRFGKIPWRRDKLPSPAFLGFPGGSASKKKSTCNVGDLGLIPWFRRSPGEVNSYPFQYSGLENSMHWIVHGVTKNQTRLSNFHFHFTFHTLYFLIFIYLTFSFSIQQSTGTEVASISWLSWIMLPWTWEGRLHSEIIIS